MKVWTLLISLASAAVVSAGTSSQLLAFTSAQTHDLTLPALQSVSGFVHSLFSEDQLAATCSLDAIAVINVQNKDIDRQAFAGLSHSASSLRARALDAPVQVTFVAAQDESTAIAIQEAVRLCRSKDLQKVNAQAGEMIRPSVDHSQTLALVQINISDLRSEEADLIKTLASLDDTHSRNLIILQSSSEKRFSKRQLLQSSLASSGNWTEPSGGVFARYQLFSTPLILTLLLVGGLLVPIVYFAVSQLAQIQTPDQMGVRKDPISGDKKTQ